MNEILQNKKILIVDDEQAMLDIVKTVLKREGAQPTGINTASKGLQTAQSERFQAIILDRYMPDGDGHEILKELKSSPKTREIPVIMLTGEKESKEIKKSIDLGATGYIIKPFKPSDFLKQLEKLLDPNAMWG